ncbi:YhfC family glutamic-type intramembrane protease [Enterococcus rivorum]|nr:YhfC family glutamic-type intramembrane protease [Enterococcus rivorum]MBP2097295.1 putative membrane protein YhfC [Enterococcus rivorum]
MSYYIGVKTNKCKVSDRMILNKEFNFSSFSKAFGFGCLSFFLSQIVLRLPLLSMLSENNDFLLFSAINPIGYGLLLAFSAGLFEETTRWFLIKNALKNEMTWINGVWFGLGHGLLEAVLFFCFAIAFSKRKRIK